MANSFGAQRYRETRAVEQFQRLTPVRLAHSHSDLKMEGTNHAQKDCWPDLGWSQPPQVYCRPRLWTSWASRYVAQPTDRVVMFRLRTGHSCLRSHIDSKTRIGESEIGPCDTVLGTTERLLQQWPQHNDSLSLRDIACFGVPTSLRIKFIGDGPNSSKEQTHRQQPQFFLCCKVFRSLLNVPATYKLYPGNGFAPTILRGATLRYKLQIKLTISPSHSILTPGQSVLALTI